MTTQITDLRQLSYIAGMAHGLDETISNDFCNKVRGLHCACESKLKKSIDESLFVLAYNTAFADLDYKLEFIHGLFDQLGEFYDMNYNMDEYSSYVLTSRLNGKLCDEITAYLGIPFEKSYHPNYTYIWSGVNIIDVLSKIYGASGGLEIYSKKNIKIFNYFRNIQTIAENLKFHNQKYTSIKLPMFKYKLSDIGIAPFKARESDAGFDLHLVKKIKEENGVHYFDTGVSIKPEFGYYCEIVGRSSIAKTGYMLANNIGIIDACYNGNFIVALIKVNQNAPEITLPMRLVQLIPRKHISIGMTKVDDLDETSRNNDGGLGSKNITG